jgi:hypothetical protein
MQQQNAANAKIFTERTDRLAKALGVPVRSLGPFLAISGTTLFLCRKEDAAISKKTWRKLERAEERAGRPDLTGQLIKETPEEAGAEWEAPPEPTREQILAFVEQALLRARRTPGGMGHLWHLLRKGIPPDAFPPAIDQS